MNKPAKVKRIGPYRRHVLARVADLVKASDETRTGAIIQAFNASNQTRTVGDGAVIVATMLAHMTSMHAPGDRKAFVDAVLTMTRMMVERGDAEAEKAAA